MLHDHRYRPADDTADPAAALDTYCERLTDWADAVLTQRPLDNVFPVAAPPTQDNAQALLRRLNFIRQRILSY